MIDIDKYEGHTPAEEWGNMVYADGYRPIFLDDDVYANLADTQLMTDAPKLLAEVKRLREVVDKQQMQYVNLETAHYNSPSQIEIKHEIDTAVEYHTENIKKYMKEKNKQLHAEVKRLRDKLFEAEIHIDPLTDDYTFENDIKELHYIEEEREND